MSESQRKRQRTTPRNSNANEQSAAPAQTPYANLRQLASMIKKPAATPFRRAVSAGPDATPGTARSGKKTPETGGRTPKSGARAGLYSRPVIARRGPPTTPHAIRALQQRRNAALTPGKSRRKSGRMQRETPRDTLRALSRILAKKSKPIVVSPDTAKKPSRNPLLEDIDDGPDPRIPRLSMPLEFESDDEDAPPRLSVLPDDVDDENLTANLTGISLETGRRAASEDLRFSRHSLGRLSGRFPDINEFDFDMAEGPDVDGTFIRGDANLLDDDDDIVIEDGTINLADENTADLRALMDTTRGRSRYSDLDIPGMEDDDNEPTFQFQIGRRDRLSQPVFTREPALDTYEGAADMLVDDEDDVVDESDIEEQDIEERTLNENLRAESPRNGITVAELESRKKRKRKSLKRSRHGIEYPSLPQSVVKKVATSYARLHGNSNAKLSKETLAAIVEASDWFFEQVGEDLGAYAAHAGRKTIEDGDVVTLMKRQRQLNPSNTAFSLAQKYLPRELLQEIRMPPPAKMKKGKRKRLETIEEEDD